jgi:hypothetical protein
MQAYIFISRTASKDRDVAQNKVVSKFLCPVWPDRLKILSALWEVLVAGHLGGSGLSSDLLRVHLYDQHPFCPMM